MSLVLRPPPPAPATTPEPQETDAKPGSPVVVTHHSHIECLLEMWVYNVLHMIAAAAVQRNYERVVHRLGPVGLAVQHLAHDHPVAPAREQQRYVRCAGSSCRGGAQGGGTSSLATAERTLATVAG